jgi:hypothetical protein
MGLTALENIEQGEPMELNITQELARLEGMTVNQLRVKFAEAFGETTRARHKRWLVKRIAWRMQALAEGDLSHRARKRALQLARDADLRLSPPTLKFLSPQAEPNAQLCIPMDQRLPKPGTVITRPYKGQTFQVKVLAHGFEFEGEYFKSLSAAAKKITGWHCNGYLFFRLGGGSR